MGDSAVAIELEARIDAQVNARAIQLADIVRRRQFPGVRDVVPTYHSVAIYFDPLRTRVEGLVSWLDDLAAHSTNAPEHKSDRIRVPVCYGGDFGPDLESVAHLAGLSPDQVVSTHAATLYRVFMLGFVPGFAYMGTVDARIAAPRLTTPRLSVPAGSVGIAGQQTGIYPSQTPGGWQLVGRTPLRPFDAARAEPFLFTAGDHVEFVPINRHEFERLAAASCAVT
jgi:KipI family sensor histidine kinase inhibitor